MRAVSIALTAVFAASAAAPARAQVTPAVDTMAREAPAREAPVRLHCMSTEQWRRETFGQKLLDPFQCMRETALRLQAEALGARLCRLGEIVLYEINLLHQNGRIQRVLVDAVSGRPHSGRIEK